MIQRVFELCIGSLIRLYSQAPQRQGPDFNSTLPMSTGCLCAGHLPSSLLCLPVCFSAFIPLGFNTCVWQAHKRSIRTILWCQWFVTFFYFHFSWKSPQVQTLLRLLFSSVLEGLVFSSFKYYGTFGCQGLTARPKRICLHCPANPWKHMGMYASKEGDDLTPFITSPGAQMG